MSARTLLSCASAGILSLASVHAAPQFRSLSPGNQATPNSSSWVNHLNSMNEAERQRRVHTYGMPPAPPNRWANRVNTRPAVQRATPPPARTTPESLYQNRPPVVAPKVQPPARVPTTRYAPPTQPNRYSPPTRQAQPVRQAPPVTHSPSVMKAKPVAQAQPVRQAKPVRFTPPAPKAQPVLFNPPAPRAQPVRFTPPTPKVKPVKQTQPVKRLRLLPWKSSQLKSKPQPVSREDKLRQQVAFMPTNSTNVSRANPYAPYASRAEYDKAIRRSKWQPRAQSAKLLAEQRKRPSRKLQAKPKKRWSIGSIFKRKSSKPKQRALATRSNTTPRVPNSTYVTAGLPQSNSDSGSMIETTLLGN